MSFEIQSMDEVALIVARVARSPLLRGASEVDRALVTTIASELASNISKYARRGRLSLERTESDGNIDICLSAEDNGPGIADLALALNDHFSTSGSLGLGLPGVKRMADEFTLRSVVDTGTSVFARKRIAGHPYQRKPELPQDHVLPDPAIHKENWDASARVRPFPGAQKCGDAALAIECAGGLLLAIIDASGHGTRASAVAEQAVEVLTREGGPNVVALLGTIHHVLQGTLGAAAGLAFVDPRSGKVTYAGVGNTRATKLGAIPWQGVSRDGTLGERLPAYFPDQSIILEKGDILMLTTDGIPEIAGRKFVTERGYWGAANITQRLLAELAKLHDDAGCVILKWAP